MAQPLSERSRMESVVRGVLGAARRETTVQAAVEVLKRTVDGHPSRAVAIALLSDDITDASERLRRAALIAESVPTRVYAHQNKSGVRSTRTGGAATTTPFPHRTK